MAVNTIYYTFLWKVIQECANNMQVNRKWNATHFCLKKLAEFTSIVPHVNFDFYKDNK